MKALTKNLKYFGALTILFSIVFFYYLYTSINMQSFENIVLYAILYGAALFISAFILGYNDPVRKSKLDLGFHYHLITYVIVNLIGISALFLAMGFNSDTIINASLNLIFWGLGLLVHYYFSTRSIKGIDKNQIFD